MVGGSHTRVAAAVPSNDAWRPCSLHPLGPLPVSVLASATQHSSCSVIAYATMVGTVTPTSCLCEYKTKYVRKTRLAAIC